MAAIKQTLRLVLKDDELIELIRILMDDDADGALVWLKTRFKGTARDRWEGG